MIGIGQLQNRFVVLPQTKDIGKCCKYIQHVQINNYLKHTAVFSTVIPRSASLQIDLSR